MKQVPARAIEPIAGTLVHYEQFPSERVRSRAVDVWLPEGYDVTSATRYPVIYMHDGQSFYFTLKPRRWLEWIYFGRSTNASVV